MSSEATPAVSVLMVGYNSLAHLDDALSAIPAAAVRWPFEVLFVNNGGDGSEAHLAAAFPEVRVLPTRGNVGFAAGNNYLAREAAGRWLLLLNPDTRLAPGAIDLLVEAAQSDERYKVLGGTSLSPDGTPLPVTQLQLPSFGRLVCKLVGLQAVATALADKGGIVPAEAVSGGFMLIERATWEQLGGLDERYFLYAEELDFCARLRRSGALVGVVPHARMVHDVGSGDAHSPQRLLFSLRGIATYYRKHFSLPYAWACLAVHWLDCVKRYLAGRVLGRSSPRWRAIAASMDDAALRPWRWMGGY